MVRLGDPLTRVVCRGNVFPCCFGWFGGIAGRVDTISVWCTKVYTWYCVVGGSQDDGIPCKPFAGLGRYVACRMAQYVSSSVGKSGKFLNRDLGWGSGVSAVWARPRVLCALCVK